MTNQNTGNRKHGFPRVLICQAKNRSFFNGGNPKEGFAKRPLLYLFHRSSKKDKIYIFGKRSFDFPTIISCCLDVNVSCYSATSELSVCKACYRRLIKVKKASDHLEELKGELKAIYKDREHPRTKRLLSAQNDNGETAASCRGKASKCLQFSIDTTCTSSDVTGNSNEIINEQEHYFTPTKLPIIGVSPIRSHPYGLVLKAFPSQLRPTCEIPLPILTSTPVTSKAASGHASNPSETSKTVLTVQYSSKTNI